MQMGKFLFDTLINRWQFAKSGWGVGVREVEKWDKVTKKDLPLKEV